MRKLFFIALIASVAGTLNAQEAGIGIGISTNGLEGKYWMGQSNALSMHWNLGTQLAADYLFDKPDLLKLTDTPTPVYYGFGAGLGTHKGVNDSGEGTTELDLNIRGVIGISYYISSFPMDIYIESVPSLGLLGGTGLSFGGSFGFRYFF
ncbi:MAG: hypothetical protein K9N35_00595 [Candidatus Marinimicrobia bacterium]|nr:hypothetical protein [Candidatus Neomarinimicrobiota bacterium]